MRKLGYRRAVLVTILFAGVMLVVGGPWYLRALWYTGNPVYPFFRQVFGGAGLDEVLDPIKRPLAVTVLNLLTALGPLTLQPDRFDSFAHQLGPVFLLFLPALLLERPPRRVLAIVALGYAFLTICLTQRQSMRFVLIAVGPLAVGVAWLAQQWWERPELPGRILVATLLAGARLRVGPGPGAGAARAARRARARGRRPLSRAPRADLPRRALDGRPSARIGAGRRPGPSRLLPARGPTRWSWPTAEGRGWAAAVNRPAAVVDHFERAGFTHLLLCPPVPETAVEFDPTLGRLLAPWLAEREPLFHEEIADADGVIRRYAIYELARRYSPTRRERR